MDLHTIREIVRPVSRTELPQWVAGDAWLAGGTWLFSEPQPHLGRLVDLNDLCWPAVTATDAGLEIAATCTIAQLSQFALSSDRSHWRALPLVEQCCRAFLASFKIWKAATVGGNLCMSLPAGPMISLTSALEGSCTLWAPDGSVRQVKVVDFVTGNQKNALAPGELLRSVLLPASVLARRTAFRQLSLAPHGRSGVLVIATSGADQPFTLTVTASTIRPVQLAFDTLPPAEALAQVLAQEVPTGLYHTDVHGAPEWRRQMTLRLAEEVRAELSHGVP